MTDLVRNLTGTPLEGIGQVKPRGTRQSFTMEYKPAFHAANDQRPKTKDDLITA